MTTNLPLLFLGVAAATLTGCAGINPDPSATADLKSLSGSTVTGKVHLVQHSHGMVKVSGQVSGLKPNSQHGFHIHENGDCSSPDGSSAGGHFNPNNAAHGKHGQASHHVGDLPNLQANDKGMAIVQYEISQISLGSGTHDVVNRALVVHANPDDYTSQPAGNSGARLACGVILRP